MALELVINVLPALVNGWLATILKPARSIVISLSLGINMSVKM